MKQFYICSKAVAESKRTIFKNRAHYIEIPNGYILMVCDFGDDEHTENMWINTPGVELLPHTHHETDKPLDPRHVDLLREQGLEQGDTVVELSNKAARHHPHMRIPRFNRGL
jgi:hypothetical protein